MNVTNDFDKHPDFIVYSEAPFNGNAPLAFLVQEFITENDVFFARNHGTVPQVKKEDFRLNVDGLVRTPTT